MIGRNTFMFMYMLKLSDREKKIGNVGGRE